MYFPLYATEIGKVLVLGVLTLIHQHLLFRQQLLSWQQISSKNSLHQQVYRLLGQVLRNAIALQQLRKLDSTSLLQINLGFDHPRVQPILRCFDNFCLRFAGFSAAPLTFRQAFATSYRLL